MNPCVRLTAALCTIAIGFLLSPTPASAQVSGSCIETTDDDDDGIGGDFLTSGVLAVFGTCDDVDSELYEDPSPSEVKTNLFQFDFGTGTPLVAVKISVAGVNTDFPVDVTARQISPAEAAALTAANHPGVACIPVMNPNCVLVEVSEPDLAWFDGPVVVTYFWNLPAISSSQDVRLLKGPLGGDFEEDITTQVLILTPEAGDLGPEDPGVRGQIGNPPSFSQFLPVVAEADSTNALKVFMGRAQLQHRLMRYDLRAELFKGNVRMSVGEISSVPAGGVNFSGALLHTIPLPEPSARLEEGNTLKLVVKVRNACFGSINKRGGARLWHNGVDGDSRLVLIGDPNEGDPNEAQIYYLRKIGRTEFRLLPQIGNSRKAEDVSVGLPCGAFRTLGTWTGQVQEDAP